MSETHHSYYDTPILVGEPVDGFNFSQLGICERYFTDSTPIGDLTPRGGEFLMLGQTRITYAEFILLREGFNLGCNPQKLLEFLRRPL